MGGQLAGRCGAPGDRCGGAASIRGKCHLQEWACGCQQLGLMLRSPIPFEKLPSLRVVNCAPTDLVRGEIPLIAYDHNP